MKKFTFKKYIPTGRFRSFEEECGDIKLNKVTVGSITEQREDGKYRIGLMVLKEDIMEDGNPNCVWKWIWLKYKGTSWNDAKSFVNTFYKEIQEKYNIYKQMEG